MKKFENVTYRGNEPIQSHLPWKVGPLHVFFLLFCRIHLMNIYAQEKLEKNLK